MLRAEKALSKGELGGGGTFFLGAIKSNAIARRD